MKSIFTKSVLALALVSLASCGGGSSTSGGSTSSAATLNVTNMAGGKTNIAGTWVTSCIAFTPDYKIKIELTSSTYKLTTTNYTTSDGSCGGATSIYGTESGTLTLGADSSATGWIDSTTGALTTPPLAKDGSQLPATPTATLITYVATAATGGFAPADPTTFPSISSY
jgi:hypothetical protein